MDPQTEDFLQILQIVDLQKPLNRLGGWAASADFIKIVYKELFKLLKKKDEFVVLECGSGVSTILIGLFLKKYAPKATLVTLDHDFNYFQKSLNEIELHDLQNVQLLYAPLKPYQIEEKIWLWYDLEGLKNIQTIDMLIVDGPPMVIQKMARYPAIALLKSKLSEDVVVILDDAYRIDEKKIVSEWKKELDFLEEFVESEKGTSILRPISLRYKPFVTIAIPTYNRLDFLKEAVASALKQTYTNIEVIVCDDGSAIDVGDVLKKAFEDERLKVIRNEINRGRPYTRNRLVHEAKGEYILWLDDDDILLDDTLKEYVNILNSLQPRPDVIYGNLEVFGADDTKYYLLDFYNNPSHLGYQLFSCFGSPIPNPGTMIKKELFKQYGVYDVEFTRAQDYEFWCRIWDKTIFKKLDKNVVRYRIHDGNVSGVDLLSADRSFESYAIRKHFNENVLTIAFSNIDSSLAFFTFSQLLGSSLDLTNAFYYLYNFAPNGEAIEQSIIKIGDQRLIEWYLQNGGKLKALKELKKLLKIIKKSALSSELINNLFDRFGHSWIFHYATSKYLLHIDSKEAHKHARASLIINPYSQDSFAIMQQLGKESEAEAIIGRLIRPVNRYEMKKEKLFEEIFGE